MIMAEEMIDVKVRLGEELANEINKMNKTELKNKLVATILRSFVQDETIKRIEKSNEKLQTKLDIAQSYIEQGRSMIDAVMERWHEYDV